MRTRRALYARAALLASMLLGSSARAQFDDFPDDAGGPPAARPAPRQAAPTDDPFEADFGASSPSVSPAPASSPQASGRAAPPAATPPTPQANAPAVAAPANPQASAPAPVAPVTADALRPPASEADLDPSAHAVRLRELEQRIHELKEHIFRSKARLALLAESVLEGLSAGARARIVHEDAMGPSYRLVRATYAIDGQPVFSRQDDDGSFGELDEFDVFEGSLVPGDHTLSVTLEYRGHGFGVFSYLRGYRFRTRASYSFNVPDGRAITIRVTGFEDGGPNVPLEDRPAVRFGQRVESIADAEARAAATDGDGTEEAPSE